MDSITLPRTIYVYSTDYGNVYTYRTPNVPSYGTFENTITLQYGQRVRDYFPSKCHYKFMNILIDNHFGNQNRSSELHCPFTEAAHPDKYATLDISQMFERSCSNDCNCDCSCCNPQNISCTLKYKEIQDSGYFIAGYCTTTDELYDMLLDGFCPLCKKYI